MELDAGKGRYEVLNHGIVMTQKEAIHTTKSLQKYNGAT